ncbi:hypothetical protein CLOM_g21769 [Closterium sp. NIES-68]|nr:hypothetical protein CLOM_g21769 [Closterium sp. NIES-68]GJP79858.1 hypothetical protein CLOP_g10060 [Closterium sp. NIES-67]
MRKPGAVAAMSPAMGDPEYSPAASRQSLMADDAQLSRSYSGYQNIAVATPPQPPDAPSPHTAVNVKVEPMVLSFHNVSYTVVNKRTPGAKKIKPAAPAAGGGGNDARFESLNSDDEGGMDMGGAGDVSPEPQSLSEQGLTVKKKKVYRTILKDISGFARSQEVLAIMGSSGSGKTTLLDVLAHRIAEAKPSRLSQKEGGKVKSGRTGNVELNGVSMSGSIMRRISAYVMQDDLMHATLTARETLMFSAEMNLPSETFSQKEKQERVERLLELLGLQHAANTIIGDEDRRGVSGGERKRVAIGAQIVHDPKILFLDEPTSGLDSSNAYRVVKICKDIAVESRSIVIMVIHQPSFRVLELLDQLLLMATGNTIFFGPPPELPAFFDSFGTPVPQFANPTEFGLELLDQLANTDTGLSELVAYADEYHRGKDLTGGRGGRGGGMGALPPIPDDGSAAASPVSACDVVPEDSPAAAKAAAAAAVVASNHKGTRQYANSWFRELCVLTARSALMIRRNPALYALRLALLAVAGFMLATLFYRPDYDPTGLLERLAFLSFIVAVLFFCSADATPIFISERHIFIRETSHNTYRSSTYVIATTVVYLPLYFMMALIITLESWWCVGLTGGFSGICFFCLMCFTCLFTGNAIATLCSSFFTNVILAYAMVISLMAYFTLVCGFYIQRTSIPKFWIWLHYISPMKYAYEGLALNEFDREDGACYLTVEQIFTVKPFNEYVNATKAKSAMDVFIPTLATNATAGLNETSCILYGPRIAHGFLEINELGKWECLAVLFGLAMFIRVCYFFVLTSIYKEKRK